jgi:hypothetical protein
MRLSKEQLRVVRFRYPSPYTSILPPVKKVLIG